MDTITTATNATKGTLVTGANLVVTGLQVFNIVDLSDAQQAWIYSAVNFVGLLWILATRNWSRLRKTA